MFSRPSFCQHVIKELVHAFSCAYIELWMHLGSLGGTQEARDALGCRLERSCLSTELGFRVGFRVGFSSWILELDFGVRIFWRDFQ